MASDPLVAAGMSTHAAIDHSAAGVEHMDCCQRIAVAEAGIAAAAVVIARKEMGRVLLLHPCRVKGRS
jgi:hypothetical protein